MGLFSKRAAGLSLCLSGALWLGAGAARADRVHLVGGSVIEGKVTREGDKVVIALDSGNVRLSAASVVRIEKSETVADRIAARRASLAKDAVAERLALASECRDERLTQCERELLREIVALQPDHAEARARLGYVRAEGGAWITREAQQRAQSAGSAATVASAAADQSAALRRAELERGEAELARRKAELALEAERIAMRQAETRAREGQSANYAPLWLAPIGYGYRPGAPPSYVLTPPQVSAPAFGINGVRDPASYFR